MRTVLVRHGESVSAETDPHKSLSPTGQRQTQQIADLLAPFPVAQVYHSDKLRAKQTAEILAPKGPLILHPHLGPMDDIHPILTEVQQSEQPLMIVSHLPFLERLLSTLLFGKEIAPWVDFCPSCVVCLERQGGWTLQWMVTPRSLDHTL